MVTLGSMIRYLDDIHTESNTYKMSRYSLVQFAFGNKKYYKHTYPISKQQQKGKK